MNSSQLVISKTLVAVLAFGMASCASYETARYEARHAAAAASAASGPSCAIAHPPSGTPTSKAPYDTARYQTTDMVLSSYSTENLPGNQVWGRPVSYLASDQRVAYQVFIRGGLLYESDGDLLDTSQATSAHSARRAIFVMDHYGRIYLSLCHAVGNFHHSSFLAGAPVAAAGELHVERGVLLLTTRASGHYRPDKQYQDQLFVELQRQGVDISKVQRIDGF